MIVVKLQGGLGNQLFQFSAYVKLLKSGKDVYLDVTEYNLPKNNGYRKFLLDAFQTRIKTKLCLFTDNIFKQLKCKFFCPEISCFKSFELELLKKLDTHWGECLSDNLSEIQDNTYVIGYFLSERFFVKDLKNFISFKELGENKKIENLYNDIKKNNSVSVHIRRTDYLNTEINNYCNICTNEYYKNAIKYIEKIDKNSKFFFFSDDIKWVKKEFGNKGNFFYVEHEDYNDTTISDLFLMSSCKHNIIANSTYSWWGAFFNSNIDKIVIRPSKYQNNSNINIFPDDWIVVV